MLFWAYAGLPEAGFWRAVSYSSAVLPTNISRAEAAEEFIGIT